MRKAFLFILTSMVKNRWTGRNQCRRVRSGSRDNFILSCSFAADGDSKHTGFQVRFTTHCTVVHSSYWIAAIESLGSLSHNACNRQFLRNSSSPTPQLNCSRVQAQTQNVPARSSRWGKHGFEALGPHPELVPLFACKSKFWNDLVSPSFSLLDDGNRQ